MKFSRRDWIWLGVLGVVATVVYQVPAIIQAMGGASRDTARGVGEGMAVVTGTAIKETGEQLQQIASKFSQGQIERTFRSYAARVSEAGGTELHMATLYQNEEVTEKDTATLFWGKLNLGTNVSSIKFPVTYRYHVDLSGSWNVYRNGEVLVVGAPPLQATLPPAIDTEGIMKQSESAWLRFDSDEQMTALEKTLTPYATQMAGSPEKISLVMERARLSMAKFIQLWLINHDQWESEKITSIKVFFGDELKELKTEDLLKPSENSLKLKSTLP